MPFQATEIHGVYLFTPRLFEDSRGAFFESFRPDQVLAETGYDFKVAQVNNSVSGRGVVRGIHFKQNPPGQAKFVSVHSGSIIDVVIDLRKSSPTFLKWTMAKLSATNRQSLFIGNGIGHGFISLENNTQVSYLCDTVFEPHLEHAINPLTVGVDWQKLAKDSSLIALISDKDLAAPDLNDAGHLLFD